MSASLPLPNQRHAHSRSPALSEKRQNQITRVIVKAAQILQQHGAESQLIEETTVRLGQALGLDSTEVALSANAIVLTSRFQGRCVTTTRRVVDRGINMHMVCEVQRITLLAEKQICHFEEVKQRLERLKPFKYNRWLVVLMIGLSCGSFSRLFGGDALVFMTTFVAAASAMFVRQELAHRHHNPLIIFASTATVATLLASVGVHWSWGNQPQLAMAASVLLLVPGFPLINAVSDMLKGHINMGIARWFFATLLTMSAAMGIALGMRLSGL